MGLLFRSEDAPEAALSGQPEGFSVVERDGRRGRVYGAKKGVNLGLVEAPEALAAGDAALLGALARNLIDNAIRYTPAGGRGSAEEGQGLGPSIVARIAELHRAELSLGEGLEGRGLKVTVAFPRAQSRM